MTDWKILSIARGLQLSDAELARLAAVMEPLETASQSLVAHLTHDIQPATILAEEALVTE